MEKILIAEDDKDICDLLEIYLNSEGYELVIVNDGQSCLEAISKDQFDLVILDIMMPKIDGYQLTRYIRKNDEMPIIIISAKDETHDKVLGLNIGADDYITKPFNPLELVARVNAQLRRGRKQIEMTAMQAIEKKYKDLLVSVENCRIFKSDTEIYLTATEYKILNLLIGSPGRIFSKEQISRQISADYFDGSENAIVVHISNLRDKLGVSDDGTQYIKTVKGLGYKIV